MSINNVFTIWLTCYIHAISARITGGMEGISPALQGVVPGTSYGHLIPARDGVIPGTNSELIKINIPGWLTIPTNFFNDSN